MQAIYRWQVSLSSTIVVAATVVVYQRSQHILTIVLIGLASLVAAAISADLFKGPLTVR